MRVKYRNLGNRPERRVVDVVARSSNSPKAKTKIHLVAHHDDSITECGLDIGDGWYVYSGNMSTGTWSFSGCSRCSKVRYPDTVAVASKSVDIEIAHPAENVIWKQSASTNQQRHASKANDMSGNIQQVMSDQLTRIELAKRGITVVASKRFGDDAGLIAWARKQGLAVDISRKAQWGNPFEMPADGDRDEVCDNFANHYLKFRPSLLKQLPTLKGKVLVCWCHPERCHGDHLAELANATP